MSEKERILRLTSYKSLLTRFKAMGFIRVFSDNIAEALDISSSLVRKDFSLFGITGIQKGGYHIDGIIEKIDKIIGLKEPQKIIIIGAGRIGQALMHFKQFQEDSISIIAGFDVDGKKINESGTVPVYHTDHLDKFVSENEVKLAVLAVPALVAVEAFEIIKKAGIKGVLNFTPVILKGNEHMHVRNINIEHELTNLVYFVNNSVKTNKLSINDKK